MDPIDHALAALLTAGGAALLIFAVTFAWAVGRGCS